jgi:hypothetical protein
VQLLPLVGHRTGRMIVVGKGHDNVGHHTRQNALEGMNNNGVFLLCCRRILNFAPSRLNFGGLLFRTKFVICVFIDSSCDWSNDLCVSTRSFL